MKLYLLGGFLGSGKTTAIHHACSLLKDRMRVAVITNDQGAQLVDSGFIESLQVPLREVVNGCFCCNYTELDAGLRSLVMQNEPDVVFAESVGSCTDLIATVVNPLLYDHPSLEIVVSVFADAGILLHGMRGFQPVFDAEVEYIYRKQLEEADVLVVNKIDLVQPGDLQELENQLGARYPNKKIMYQNSLEEKDILHWIACLEGFGLPAVRKSLVLDYDTYATGEAKLGWLDEELEILAMDGKAAEAALILIRKLDEAIRDAGYAIGHLKFLLNDGQRKQKISFVSLHRGNEIIVREGSGSNHCRLLINARVQADPAALKELVLNASEQLKNEMNCKVIQRKMLAFRPGYPKPVHRLVS